ncbi:glycerophosphodiester phosphodiesterase family protein, partial [Clostridium polynesiense]|uniref:glycerophosphodiester phosphodiesterase family protein n=1 Tax=Clostridium polynesiense TaxID=1325933 RepID=UPI00059095DB
MFEVIILTLNYAHRGASGYYPENTMLAFEKAVEMGCQGIETDVQMTSDGVLVLIHDESLKRTTGVDALVKDYTFDDIRKLNAADYHSSKDSFQQIPTAMELLEFAKNKDIIINFEIKTGIVFYEGIEEKLINLIYKYGMEKKVIISSFNHYAVAESKRIAPEIKTAILYSEGLYHPEAYCETVGADGLHPVLFA